MHKKLKVGVVYGGKSGEHEVSIISSLSIIENIDKFKYGVKEIFVNEINTIPGFTKISMYPRLWEASGLSYSKLIDELIGLALERYNERGKNRTSFPSKLLKK